MNSFKLRARINFWPRHPMDWGLFMITLILMPTIFIYEMFTVYPKVWNFWPNFHDFIPYGGSFVFSNIVTNFVGLIVTDTSIPQDIMSATNKPSLKWQFCNECISYVPPRSWHCKYCKSCILKRDHHCLFSGCCVGHFNYRFFIMFLIYVFIGTLYCVLSDSMFLMNKVDFTSPSALLKIGFPAFAYLSGMETLENECYILLYIINWASLIFASVMLIFHLKISLKGQVTHDVTVQSFNYDFGKYQNLKEVMGNRWYIAWIFPFFSSPLPSNGMQWNTLGEFVLKCQKLTHKSK